MRRKRMQSQVSPWTIVPMAGCIWFVSLTTSPSRAASGDQLPAPVGFSAGELRTARHVAFANLQFWSQRPVRLAADEQEGRMKQYDPG
jgi:hypothetical protein